MVKTAAIQILKSCFYYQAVQNDVFHLFTLEIEANYYFVLLIIIIISQQFLYF